MRRSGRLRMNTGRKGEGTKRGENGQLCGGSNMGFRSLHERAQREVRLWVAGGLVGIVVDLRDSKNHEKRKGRMPRGRRPRRRARAK